MATLILCGATLVSGARASAQTPETVATTEPAPSASPTPGPERYGAHAQTTITQQYHGGFPAAYSGAQSLSDRPDTAKTFDLTLFLGAHVWRGGEVYVNPELDQGFGLGHPSPPGRPYVGTIGVAGFVSGEAYKVGRDESYGRIQRLFVRQTVDLAGDPQAVDPDINQLGGAVRAKHLTLTAGKFSVTDVFDNNAYAHDPKNDFLNWSLIDMGAFDYAADAWGFTDGISAELVGPHRALRAGLFQLSLTPNDIAIERTPFRQYSPIVEYEIDTSFFGGRPGAFKALAYGDDGYMGSYADAVAAAAGTGMPPSTAAVRSAKHWKTGAGLNLAQEIAPHVGLFARASAMNGTWEAFDFTEIDRSLSGGISIDGGLYHRPSDAFGLAGSLNTLSAPADRYFAAGGIGILAGDGGLSYAGERILETYYKVGITKHFGLTADYQRIANPAYNAARGPVSIYGLRYHAQL